MGLRGLRAVFATAAFSVMVLASAGCGAGGSGESAAETVPPMTEKKLGEKLGDICQEHTDRQVIAIEQFDKKHGLPYGPAHEKATPAQLEKELVVVILPIVRDNIRDLKKELRPPPSQEANLKAFYKALEHGIEFSEKDPNWVTDSAPTEPFMKARLLSVKLGTPLCGQA
jgi:hypothetical protein